MINSIVKWSGGKGRVLPDLLPLLPKGDCLVEPFVGGVSVFLNTQYRRYVLGDINPHLINLYRCITHHPTLVIESARELFKSYNSKEGYAKIRSAFNNQRHSPHRSSWVLESIGRAAQFLYLNRHGYNGGVRYNRQCGYNVPFGNHKSSPYFPEEQIRLFAEKANDTKALFIFCLSQNTLKVMIGSESVIYCDLPYVPISDTVNFTQYYSTPFAEKELRQFQPLGQTPVTVYRERRKPSNQITSRRNE